MEIVSIRLGSLETNKIVAKSTFIDPRFKKTAFGQEANTKNAQHWVMNEFAAMCASSATVPEVDEKSPEETNYAATLWSHFDQKLKDVGVQTTLATTAVLSVRQYLELPHCDRKLNPLYFWEKKKHMMAELYELHLKYSVTPATSVPSERLFSKAGQVTNVRRNRLPPKNLHMILFLNSSS